MSFTKQAAFTLAALLFFTPAFAAHEGPVHYESEQPTSVKHAIELLEKREVLATKALKEKHLEGVHEQSYTLEAAGDFLEADLKKRQALVDNINEAVQEIHALSEKGDEAGVKKALARLKKHTGELK